MGIKGIYGEIGSGRRVALAKLSNDKLAEAGRPLRIAIDISIWLFQVQSSQGGPSPAIRTLYYRLVRLLGNIIQPLFVFDGPGRPAVKRNKPTANGGQLLSRKAKRLLELFGFPYLTAPGEAEAECALLQRHGVVDYVLSEDVDTLAFGCWATMRNWSSASERANLAPTHVNVFEASSIKAGKSGLDGEGMILVALMSGGDYITAGIPRCGIKLACEAARANFGHDLCRLDPSDETGFNEWRKRLRYELETNESGYFKTRHKALQIPDSFPNRVVLNYHTHPLVSTTEDLQRLTDNLKWSGELDIKGLRDFVDEEFEWRHLSGAKKFLRQLAPSLLSHKLFMQAGSRTSNETLEEQTEREDRLIRSISTQRNHISTDGLLELRISYIPGLVVGLDLENESVAEDEQADDLSEEEDMEPEEDVRSRSKSPTKKGRLALWDPWQPSKTWMTEGLVNLGAPLSLERWRAELRDPRATAAAKARGREANVSKGMRQGALETYLRVTKPGAHSGSSRDTPDDTDDPYELKSALKATSKQGTSDPTKRLSKSKPGQKVSKHRQTNSTALPRGSSNINPWTLARTTSTAFPQKDGTNPSLLTRSDSSSADGQEEQYGPDGSTNGKMITASDLAQRMDEIIILTTDVTEATRSVTRKVEVEKVLRHTTSQPRVHAQHNSTPQEPGISTLWTDSSSGDSLASQEEFKVSESLPKKSEAKAKASASGAYREQMRKKHSSVAVRESLEGTWKILEEFDNLSLVPKARFSNVDVVDLTSH